MGLDDREALVALLRRAAQGRRLLDHAAKIAALYGADDLHVKRESKVIDHQEAGAVDPRPERTIAPGLAAAPARAAPARRWSPTARRRARARADALRARRRHRSLGRSRRARGRRDPPARRALGRARLPGRPGRRADLAAGGGSSASPRRSRSSGSSGGAAAACAVARERRGTWFDPALVDALRDLSTTTPSGPRWTSRASTRWSPPTACCSPTTTAWTASPRRSRAIVDAKSPYTARHSEGVAEIAGGIAAALGLDAPTRRRLRRAGLLHDIGKLGVSNRILDKPGKLDAEEWVAMRRHPDLYAGHPAAVPACADVAASRPPITRSSTAAATQRPDRRRARPARRGSCRSPTSPRR